MKNLRLFFIVGLMFSALMAEDMKKEDLGRILFFDVNLSKNRTQSCATCHNPNAGFVDDRDNGVKKNGFTWR